MASLSPAATASQTCFYSSSSLSISTSRNYCRTQSRSRRVCRTLRLRVWAEQPGGKGPRRRERDDVSELEKALGIENKRTRNPSPSKDGSRRRPLSVLEALEEQMQMNAREAAPESPFIRRIRLVGDWLIDKTENSNGQDRVVAFALVAFPVWFFLLLVTAGFIQLPFHLPYLEY